MSDVSTTLLLVVDGLLAALVVVLVSASATAAVVFGVKFAWSQYRAMVSDWNDIKRWRG